MIDKFEPESSPNNPANHQPTIDRINSRSKCGPFLHNFLPLPPEQHQEQKQKQQDPDYKKRRPAQLFIWFDFFMHLVTKYGLISFSLFTLFIACANFWLLDFKVLIWFCIILYSICTVSETHTIFSVMKVLWMENWRKIISSKKVSKWRKNITKGVF